MGLELGFENTLDPSWGEGPSHAGQLRTACSLSLVGVRSLYSSVVSKLGKSSTHIHSKELGPMQRKSHVKNYTKSLLWREGEGIYIVRVQFKFQLYSSSPHVYS